MSMRRWAVGLGLIALVTLSPSVARADPLWDEYVRVTFYTLPGIMFNGERVHKGAAACSRWMPIGTQVQFSDGFVVTCKDRGHGDARWRGWIDVWAPSRAWGLRYVEADYGLYTWVSVLRWGWTEPA